MYQSNLAAVLEQMNAARDAALIAAGEVVRTEVKRRVIKGYTTGAFVTGETAASVKITVPYDGPAGRAVSVYTELMTALYWAAGHLNRFTRKYERVDHWTPSLTETTPDQLAAFNRVFARFMGQSA